MKSLRFVVLAVLCAIFSLVASAASNPKATGDASSVNIWSGDQFTLTFNAIATKVTGTNPALPAKGSLIYEDPTVTYTMDVQFVQVAGNKAWFTGQVTSTTGGCCAVGDWIFYEVQDTAEPGIGRDLIWGENLTQSGRATDQDSARNLVATKATPNIGRAEGMAITDGNIQVH